MRKTRIYLDTTIPNHLFHDDVPEKKKRTQLLWEEFQTDIYEIVISEVLFREIGRCREPKRQNMVEQIEKLNYVYVSLNEEIDEIADEIIKRGYLTKRHKIDCLQIACALYSRSKYLLSWNYDDLANHKTNKGVSEIANIYHFPTLEILLPFNFKI